MCVCSVGQNVEVAGRGDVNVLAGREYVCGYASNFWKTASQIIPIVALAVLPSLGAVSVRPVEEQLEA